MSIIIKENISSKYMCLLLQSISKGDLNNIINCITNECECPECQDDLKKKKSIIKIRIFIRNNIKKKKLVSKSITNNEIYFNYKKWMVKYLQNILDLEICLN